MPYNQQSMNGLASLSDTDFLENGILDCEGVIVTDLTTKNLNASNGVAIGESLSIGKDVTIGNSVVSPNIYTTKLVSNTFQCTNIKTDRIQLSNNLQIYDDTTIGFIKTSPIIASSTLLTTNAIKSILFLPLPVGVYTISYCFTIGLSAVSASSLHSISHGVSTNGIDLNVIQKKNYQNIVFNNDLSYATFYETGFCQIKDYSGSLHLLVMHNTLINTASNMLITNAKITVLRIA